MELFRESLLIIWSSPFIALAILVELIFSNLSGRNAYSWSGVLENVYLTTLNMGLDIAMRSLTFLSLSEVYFYRLVSWNHGWVYWLTLLVAQDFAYYWLHRLDHSCRFFWAIHVTHHTAKEFNITVGFRSSVFQPLYRFVFFLPLSLLGWLPQDILLMYSITQLYGILIHTERIGKLGWLENILVTPSHHRVHHSSNPAYLDRNMGMVFILWDKLFGTFTVEDERPHYGITKPLVTRSPYSLVFHEWYDLIKDFTSTSGLKGKVRCLFGPPGWRPPGNANRQRSDLNKNL